MDIRQATQLDINDIAELYQACFPKEQNHQLWIQSSFNSFPRGVYFVIEDQGTVCGYILWCVKNGFRSKTIVELEQIGIHPNFAGEGLGKKLISHSLTLFKAHLQSLTSDLAHDIGALIVTTSEGNFAESLYAKTMDVERAAVIKGYGSGDEVILYKKFN